MKHAEFRDKEGIGPLFVPLPGPGIGRRIDRRAPVAAHLAHLFGKPRGFGVRETRLRRLHCLLGR